MGDAFVDWHPARWGTRYRVRITFPAPRVTRQEFKARKLKATATADGYHPLRLELIGYRPSGLVIWFQCQNAARAEDFVNALAYDYSVEAVKSKPRPGPLGEVVSA